MFLIDSNVYIRAFSNLAFGQELQEFHRQHLTELVLSMVVAHELLVGAISSAQQLSLRRGLLQPFEVRRRIHIPTQRTWELAGEVDRQLRRKKSFAASLSQRSFFNDILIAATARDLGATIVTDNDKDFSIIGTVLDIRFSRPWPSSTRNTKPFGT